MPKPTVHSVVGLIGDELGDRIEHVCQFYVKLDILYNTYKYGLCIRKFYA